MSGLLSDPRLEDASDAARLAAVVALSRNPMASGQVEIRAGEMGRWAGISESAVKSSVWPELRRTGAARVTPVGGGDGVPHTGVRIELVPLWDAKGVLGHPLAVERLDVVLLLRVLEALMAPGWGPGSPFGLLAGRAGRGAPRARLALLLLTLAARESGWVRLCGGTADRKHGRPATTLARMLGLRCSPGAAARVLSQLEEAGLIEVRRRRTGSGLRHRSGILVHAVAAAHGRETRSEASIRSIADPSSAARSIETGRETEEEQVSGPDSGKIVDLADPSSTAPLHTDHSLLADVSGDGSGDRCFSGESRQGCCRRPECACAREDAAGVDGPSAEHGPGEVADGPLRGDKQTSSPDHHQEQPDLPDGRPKLSLVKSAPGDGSADRDAWRAASGGRAPADIAHVVDAVPGLWAALRTPGPQRVAATRIRAALTRIRGQLRLDEPHPADTAARILWARMARRGAESGGIPAARNPLGWLTGRALPQRPGCAVASCDDGYSVTTGDACPGCASRADSGRALRHQAWTETIGELRPGTEPTADQIAAYQHRLADLFARQQAFAAERAERHAEVVKERAARQAVLDAERAVREAARQAQPCADCGAPKAAGLCGTCHENRRTEQLMDTAVRTCTAASRIVDPGATASDLDHLTATIRQRLTDTLTDQTDSMRASGLTDAALALSRRLAAQGIHDRMRRDMLRSIGGPAAAALLDRALMDLDPEDPRPAQRGDRCAADGCHRGAVGSHGVCTRHLAHRVSGPPTDRRLPTTAARHH
ncbi:winged helix-turn-helix domain-containing protein [Streptomyces sp. SM12]|uniref:winged helix-turn-helix domain-containing protein n=1 Tax=Streptomyces sp. SM12 TaxID=1071602 RepID=UPI000CD56D71|nr:winged helix-turn-helix domain-containing protein [Streptomyces sp. SM12]